MSESQKGHKNNLGRHLSEETKLKISLARKGKKKSLDWILSRSGDKYQMYGKHCSKDTKIKISIANSGRKMCLAQKRRRSAEKINDEKI
jgi:hypothetical protein